MKAKTSVTRMNRPLRIACVLLPLLILLLVFLVLSAGDFDHSDNGDGTCTITGYTGSGGARHHNVHAAMGGSSVADGGCRVEGPHHDYGWHRIDEG